MELTGFDEHPVTVGFEVNTVAQRRQIDSDIRHRIDQLFRGAQLVITFPQRDIHLDTTEPRDVRLHPVPNQREHSDDATPVQLDQVSTE